MSTLLALVIVGWIICGVLAYGMSLASLQISFPNIAKSYYRKDVAWSFFIAVLGPFGMFGALMCWRPHHGWMYRNPHI